jgi:hypothetical protein
MHLDWWVLSWNLKPFLIEDEIPKIDWTTIVPICYNFDGEFNLRPFSTSWNHFPIVVELCINFVVGFRVQWLVHGYIASFSSSFDDCYSRHSKFMFVASKSFEFQVMVQYVDDIFYFLIVHVVESCMLLTIIIH